MLPAVSMFVHAHAVLLHMVCLVLSLPTLLSSCFLTALCCLPCLQDCFEVGRRHKIQNPEKVGGWAPRFACLPACLGTCRCMLTPPAPRPCSFLSLPTAAAAAAWLVVLLQMRETYGKLVYLLMDSCEPEIQELLEFR